MSFAAFSVPQVSVAVSTSMGSFCSLLLAGRVQVTLRLRVLRTAPSPSLTDVMTEVYVER